MPGAMDRVSPHAPPARAVDDLRELLAPGAISAVFQPIVRLADLQPIGYEGLARFPKPPGLVALPPDVTLAAAGRLGVRDELEVACWAAISEAGTPPAGRLLFVNVAPDALPHPGLLELAGRLPARLVIELTEQDAVQTMGLHAPAPDASRSGHPPITLRERLRPWIARGALVAVDDAGAGFTSLEYVAELRPDFLKLSRGMVTGVDLDPSRQAVLRATVAFAREVGARVVAEGVESPEELAILRDAEVDYGQGWLFGRPAAAWPEEPSARTAAPPRPPTGRLERELAAATNVREASEAVVEHLARKGLMPSVYLEDGGRLRCQAVRGYWQIYDGMPATAGVIGRTFRTGEATIVEDVAGSEDYLLAVASVHAEVCVPLRVRGRVAGVLTAESPTPPGAAGVAEIDRCAGLLAARLEALGGLGEVSAAQQLARTAVRLGSLEVAEDIVRETVVAARALAGFESAMLALPDGHGGYYVHHAEGSFAVALGALERPELDRIAAWVDMGTSSYTAGDRGGRGFEGHEVLREAGANAVIVIPLDSAGERHGLLLVADRANHRIDTEKAELLELLAGQAAGSLRMAAAVTELRERAARDPLTGLGHAAGDDVLRSVAGVLRAVSPTHGRAFRIGGDEFAVLFECSGEAGAWAVGWDLQAQARARLGTTMSIGLAIAVPSETDEQLVARADAALYEVKRRGRDGVLLAAQPMTSA